MNLNNQYTSGEYLKKNPSLHIEDSEWKAQQITSLIKKNNILPTSVSEVGCGAGLIIHNVARNFPSINTAHGFDIASSAIQKANELNSNNVKFIHGDILESKTFFDLILAIDVIEHIEDYIGYLRKLKSKGKTFIFHFPLEISVLSVIRNRQINSRKQVGHLHYFTKEIVLHTLIDCGYKISDWKYTRSALELNPHARSLPTRIANFMRFGTEKFDRDLSSLIFGGYSLLLLSNN